MKIPASSLTIPGVQMEKGGFQPPSAAAPEVVDMVSLANRELDANDRLTAELKGKDNSPADLDPRSGSVRLRDFAFAATGERKFTSIGLDGDKLTAQAPGRNDHLFDCRKVDGSKMEVMSDYGLPGAVPGLRFYTYPEKNSALTLSCNFSRPEMVMRMNKADLQ